MANIWLKHLARLNLPLYKYESDRMKMVYAGYSSLKKSYYVNLMLGKNHNQTFLGRRWFWKINKLIHSSECDIVVQEVSRITYRNIEQNQGYIVPEFVGMRINIDRPVSEITRRSVSHFSDLLKRIRKYNLTYEVINGEVAFNHFIDRFYLPFTKKRHGDVARIENLNATLKPSPSMFILAIKEEGNIVAEAIIKRSGDCLIGLYLGTIDGSEEYIRHGVLGAIYYFCILEGQKLGCRYVDIGSAPPFLADGLTKYKMGLGAEFVPDNSPSNEYLWLGVNEHSEVAKKFILDNPFMYFNMERQLVRCGT
jgi:hypothetical protein